MGLIAHLPLLVRLSMNVANHDPANLQYPNQTNKSKVLRAEAYIFGLPSIRVEQKMGKTELSSRNFLTELFQLFCLIRL